MSKSKSVDLSWGKRSTRRKPGPAPRREKKAEREGGRERTKQRKTTPRPTPEKTSTDTILASDCAKTDKPRVTAKVRSRKFIQKRGLRKVELCQKEGTLSKKKSCQKTDSISPSQQSKTQPQPLPQPVSKSSLPKIYPKTGAKKSRALSKRGDAFRKKSCQKTDSISPSQQSKTQPQPLPQPVSKSSLPKIYPKTGAKKSRTLSKRGDAFRKKNPAKKRTAFPPPRHKKHNRSISP